jgi:hypothetical protein
MPNSLHDIAGSVYLHFGLPAAQAADATADVAVCPLPFKCAILGIDYIPLTAVTGANTDTRTLNANVGGTNVGSLAFASGSNATAKTATAFTLTGTTADLNRAEGDVLTLQSQKSGNGLALPAGAIRVKIRGN